MQKEDITILIVDDDQTLGKALQQGLIKAGFKTHWVSKPDEAISFVKLQQIHLAIVDCMLPKMNGKDLVKKIKLETSPTLPVILMSGIYRDRGFIRDAIKETGATIFLTKPFDVDTFISEVENALKGIIDIPIPRILQFLATQELSPKERMAAIDEAETVHAFELPWLFSLLLHNKVAGHLNIISADGEVSGVGFSNGEIVQVFQEDLRSYFGVLLIEHGFITKTEIDDVVKTQGTKKLGERLVDANLLSPHAIDTVMEEQQGIRLSKTITDTSVKISFIETGEMRANAHTDRTAFTNLLNEWVVSKLTLDWLKLFYVPWMTHNLKKGPEWAQHHRVFSVPAVQKAPGISKALLESSTLADAQRVLQLSDDIFFRAVHLLVVSRVFRFGEANSASDFVDLRGRLSKLLETLEKQNYFERLGVSPKAKEVELKRAYHELAKVLHPDKLTPDTPSDIRDLAKKTFEKISLAYATLTDPKAKASYMMDLERGKADAILEAEQFAEEARPLLSKGDIRKATTLLENSVKLAPPTSEIRLLLMWAKLKKQGAEKDTAMHTDVKEEMNSVPPEDRHNTLFHFVKGLYLRVTGDLDGAKRNLEHVLAQDSEFIDARRELNILQALTPAKQGNILSGDIKDVVGLFFNRKKK